MQVASVIVDVAARQTDKEFDYKIPEKWEGLIQPGMRVIVPFGPRKIQGFVTALKNASSAKKLKSIIEPMDLLPVLNPELLKLADWLTETTLCFKISAYQAMLPAAMKAKYEKVFRLREAAASMNEELLSLFHRHDEITWEMAEKEGLLAALRQEVKANRAELIYKVTSKGKKKSIRMIGLALSDDKLADSMNALSANARKQKDVLSYLQAAELPLLPAKEVMEQTGTSNGTLKTLIEKGLLVERYQEVYRDPYENRQFEQTEPLPLTDQQQTAIAPILGSIEDVRHETFLLYGVTGSGKTEIYLQSIQRVLEKGKEAIVLVPEISLTPQMVHRFKGRFGDDVAVLHSGLSAGEKYDEWRKIQRKEVKVVVGARSAVFAPFENLGIIIIDEEHETSYKQEENPRYHARETAIERAKFYQCPVILGSATPSLESFARAQKGVYQLLSLPNRMNNQRLPDVEIVDMREELRHGNRSMFSRALFEKLTDRLEKGEQTVLFLNRRGHSSFIMCRDCGYVAGCPHCDISLTYHRYSHQMKCHYCGFEEPVPSTCPECQSEHIRYFGTGTQKVEDELGKLLPQARVVRMDVDTTSRKGSHEKLLQQFAEGKADILLGTQMIAKGLDFPNITLVGVLSADTMLHIPDFRSAEKTFQLLTQVSGRAGRHQLQGEVVIQTYTPDHYSIQLAGRQDYDQFYKEEMVMRKLGSYPPFYYLALVTVSHEDLLAASSATEKITHYIQARLSNEAIILGPVASPIARINNRYRYQCLIKYKREPKLNHVLKSVMEHYTKQHNDKGLQVAVDVNPFIMM
ncbi:primosomal protein N' [Pseudobacillus badius]|uniref:primosomal protein N' n=1 Tax=Bacillus badius TaxID=1455 RepID=UPI0007B0445C|nr:primosomal protein N' [Bacillus badius]KZO01618.1 primosomal protein N' [Bacillus badius]MED0667267.1 primosomal protein N' [Bacillus badius]OCS90012.1 primosomal protein N' [Bacillus badius]OVE53538.1 primosomal protein N' [Bacillus badius]TDW05902.1 replication restart DNA helicase PriA [Bacillus badius]